MVFLVCHKSEIKLLWKSDSLTFDSSKLLITGTKRFLSLSQILIFYPRFLLLTFVALEVRKIRISVIRASNAWSYAENQSLIEENLATIVVKRGWKIARENERQASLFLCLFIG